MLCNILSYNHSRLYLSLVLGLSFTACGDMDTEANSASDGTVISAPQYDDAGYNDAGVDPVGAMAGTEIDIEGTNAGDESASAPDEAGMAEEPCIGTEVSYDSRSLCINLNTVENTNDAEISCSPSIEDLETALEAALEADLEVALAEEADSIAEIAGTEASTEASTDSMMQVKVSCTDQDQDCYYHCEGWDLGALQDPDDRRASIPNNPSADNIDLNCVSSSTHSACLLDVYTETENEPLVQYYACENQGHAWITHSSFDPDFPYHLYLSTLERSTDEVSVFIPLPTLPDQFVCYFDDSSAPTIMLSMRSSLTEPQKLYTLNSFNSGLIELPLDILPTSLGQILINETFGNDLKVEVNGLFSWHAQTALSDVTVRHYGDSYAIQEQVENIVAERALCQNCTADEITPRLAQLSTNGEVMIVDSGNEPYPLFQAQGPFASITSSTNFLGLVPANEMVKEIYFSLWSDPLPSEDNTSLLGLPLIFDAELWGYEQVELKSIVGAQALLRLKVANDDNKYIWAIYHIINDHLTSLAEIDTPENSIALGMNLDADWQSPQLHQNHILWPINTMTDPERAPVLKVLKVDL